MKYWRRWIADLHAKTRSLSLLDRGAYDAIMDFYYLSDGPIPLDQDAIYRGCGVFSTSERAAVDRMLARFFERSESGYRHARCDAEIEVMRTYADNQARRGRMGGLAAAAKTHKPKGNGEDKAAAVALATELPDWIPAELFASWWQAKPKRARTTKARELALAELDKLRAAGHAPIAVLEHCIRSGYQGIFPPKAANGRAAPQAAPRPSITCDDCGQRAYTYTGRRCDDCYRKYMQATR